MTLRFVREGFCVHHLSGAEVIGQSPRGDFSRTVVNPRQATRCPLNRDDELSTRPQALRLMPYAVIPDLGMTA
jgi:hypothetical protein